LEPVVTNRYRAQPIIRHPARRLAVAPGGSRGRVHRRHALTSGRSRAEPVEGSAFFRGLLVAIPVGLALWALLLWVVVRLLL